MLRFLEVGDDGLVAQGGVDLEMIRIVAGRSDSARSSSGLNDPNVNFIDWTGVDTACIETLDY